MQACNTDTDCLTLNCSIGARDTPKGFAGLCAPARTPTPTGGNPFCIVDEHCQPGFYCNESEGSLCCDAKQCPLGQTCRDPRNPGFCTTLPTPTATQPPTPEPCSDSNPAACATGFCVDSNCCSTGSCPRKERCDIHGYEGNCAPRLVEGALCTKNSDCENSLQCRDLDGNGRQCIAPHQHATPVPTLVSTRIAAGARADGGCAIGKGPAPMGAAWLLLGAAVLWGCGRSQRKQACWARAQHAAPLRDAA